MGWFFRKTKKVGKSRVTVSKRGATVSVGPKGMKLNSRGRASISKRGFRFTKKLF